MDLAILKSADEFAGAIPPRAYFAMYSSWAGGILLDPALMMVPVDDHLVHRGDGVFETVKVYNGRPYLLSPHLKRLQASSGAIGIELPWTESELRRMVEALVAVVEESTFLIRMLVSRGPGGFSVNPYESVAPQLYAVAYPASPPFMEQNPAGARVGISSVEVKPTQLAVIKTCNYLPNALMKKEAVDRGLHFVIGIDREGFVAESFTENLCLVDANGVLVRPEGDYILAGTTMNRCFELAREAGIETATRGFTAAEVATAKEVLIFGTTAEVTAVVEFDGQAIGSIGSTGPIGGAGDDLPTRFGPVFHELAPRLQADIYSS